MIDLTLTIIILGLTVYQLTDLLVSQEGPYFIFEKIRIYFGVDSETEEYSLIASILSCPYCTQVWVSLGVSLLVLPFMAIDYKWLVPVAVMGMVTVLLDNN